MKQTTTNTEKIYALYDTDDDVMFYVGHTKRTLKKRLSEHLTEAFVLDTLKCQHIRYLDSIGHTVNIKLLDEVAEDKLEDLEQQWIEDLEASGCVLVNSIEGNSGLLKGHEAIELRERIQAAKKQWKKKPKKQYEKVGPPPSEQELELLNTLYETDHQQFERLRGIRAADPEKYREELMKVAKTHSDITVRYTAEMIAEPSCSVDGKDHLKELDVILEAMKNENKN